MELSVVSFSHNLYCFIGFLSLYSIACCSEKIVTEDIPADMEALVAEKHRELIEAVSEVDDKLADAFLTDEPISTADLEVHIRTKKKKFF